MENKSLLGSVLVGVMAVLALVISLYAVTHLGETHAKGVFGGTSFIQGEVYYNPSIWVNGLQIGNSGSGIAQLQEGKCSLIASTFTVTASTSVSMDCSVTGVQSGDVVVGMFATTTPTTAGPGWEITRASASSTNGFITFNVTNGTGASAVIPASLASTTQYIILR